MSLFNVSSYTDSDLKRYFLKQENVEVLRGTHYFFALDVCSDQGQSSEMVILHPHG
jgi:hypothetical protein